MIVMCNVAYVYIYMYKKKGYRASKSKVCFASSNRADSVDLEVVRVLDPFELNLIVLVFLSVHL